MTETFAEKETHKQRPRRWGVVLAWTIILVVLLVLGLGLTHNRQAPVAIGEEAPNFIFMTFDGDRIDLQSLRGKVVVINFWASWCKTCEQEAVALEQAYQSYKDKDVVFLGVDYVDTETEALAYLSTFNITYPNGPDLRTQISQTFNIQGVPETYIIGKDGLVVDVKIGPYQSLAEIENAILEALGQ